MDGLATLDGVKIDARVVESQFGSESGASSGVLELPGDLTLRFGRVRQTTIRNPISCTGIGLHSGRTINLRLLGAASDTGIVFRRVDLGVDIPARFDQVVDTRLSTVIADRADPAARVATIEHLMAALSGCGIDNALIEVDGPEIPVLDGSSAPFVFLIDCAGREAQFSPRGTIEILKRVRVENGEAFAELRPGPAASLSLSMSIAFEAPAIGRQAYSMTLSDRGFRRELSECRTFTMLHEIEALRSAGLAQGGSLDNAIVVDGSHVLNPAGLRHRDEFVRHKMLDAIGDLALAGLPIRGAFIGHRSGHALNNDLLRAVFADSSAWRLSGRGAAAGHSSEKLFAAA